MHVELNIPRGARQQEVTDYLNAALRQRSGAYSGSAGVADDGSFYSEIVGPFQLGASAPPLAWRLTKTPDGTLSRLTVTYTGDDPHPPEWEKPVYEFVTSVLAAALSEVRRSFFNRSLFYYLGVQLDGEYWLPGYRFAPAHPSDPTPYLINAERAHFSDRGR